MKNSNLLTIAISFIFFISGCGSDHDSVVIEIVPETEGTDFDDSFTEPPTNVESDMPSDENDYVQVSGNCDTYSTTCAPGLVCDLETFTCLVGYAEGCSVEKDYCMSGTFCEETSLLCLPIPGEEEVIDPYTVEVTCINNWNSSGEYDQTLRGFCIRFSHATERVQIAIRNTETNELHAQFWSDDVNAEHPFNIYSPDTWMPPLESDTQYSYLVQSKKDGENLVASDFGEFTTANWTDCGFTHSNFGNEWETNSKLYLDLESESVNINDEGNLVVPFTLSADPCGPVEIHYFSTTLFFEATYLSELFWMNELLEDDPTVSIIDMSGHNSFESIYDNEDHFTTTLSFNWCSPEVYNAFNCNESGSMESIVLEAGETRRYLFTFPFEGYVPQGSDFTFSFLEFNWNDAGLPITNARGLLSNSDRSYRGTTE